VRVSSQKDKIQVKEGVVKMSQQEVPVTTIATSIASVVERRRVGENKLARLSRKAILLYRSQMGKIMRW